MRWTQAALTASWAIAAAPAQASDRPGLAEAAAQVGVEIDGRPASAVEAMAELRARAAWLYNLDLDRGVDPAGRSIYPVPPASPASQSLRHGDLRLRTDVVLHTPRGGGVAVVRLDWFDGLAPGAAPDGPPIAAVGQAPPVRIASLRRAYGVLALPFGALAVGRMNAHWGLGMVGHGGDGADSDGGDAVDRAALVTPLFGHLWAVAFDWAATGPQAPRPADGMPIDLDPSDDVRALTFAVFQTRGAPAHARRLRAGRTTWEYGALASLRWQDRDVPATWAAASPPDALRASDWVARDLRMWTGDAFVRATGPWGRAGVELAAASGDIGAVSLLPGTSVRQPIAIRQWGAAAQSAFDAGSWTLGLDAGAASGDSAPGVAAWRDSTAPFGPLGVIRGAQVDGPRDHLLSEFRFNPNYRIDRILFRELYGAVADAAYLRPHLARSWTPFGAGDLRAEIAVLASWALAAASAPGGARPLGIEVDPTLTYRTVDGTSVQVQHALLVPLAGLDNPAAGLKARWAQLWRVQVGWAF